jgi:hypothetical protein
MPGLDGSFTMDATAETRRTQSKGFQAKLWLLHWAGRWVLIALAALGATAGLLASEAVMLPATALHPFIGAAAVGAALGGGLSLGQWRASGSGFCPETRISHRLKEECDD